jgi:pyruvate kinase
MLSGETSVGDFAIEAVQTMARIILHTENHALDRIAALDKNAQPTTKGGAITKAATEVGAIVGAKYMIAFTESGESARRMAMFRSAIPILALTPNEATYNRLALTWGVQPGIVPTVAHTDDMVKQVDQWLVEHGEAQVGDPVVIVAGAPPGIPGSTNALRVHAIGDAVGGRAAAYRQ